MADPASRKSATLSRLRSQLRRKRESLADQFDFKVYTAVVFKDKVSHKRSNEGPGRVIAAILSVKFFIWCLKKTFAITG